MNNNIFGTPLTKLYFSKKNSDAIHSAIQYRVYKDHDIRIGKQSDSELRIIMKSMYYSDGKNLTTDIINQVRCLNAKVIKYAVKQIMVQVNQYTVFQEHQNTLPVPMELPKNMSIKGHNVLNTDGFI
tara:strand:+ start:286 stop:666 length:381 start_codon:yes stop_codon:yes gene_type:complete